MTTEINQPPAKAVPRMVFPDALRAIAAVIVVLPHAVGVFAYFANPSAVTRAAIRLSAQGVYGVQIFFVLSGFVIAYTFRGVRVTPRFAAVFAVRRSVRLDPPYWAAIGLMLAFLLVRHRTAGTPMPAVGTVVAHLFYAQQILGFGEVNVVFWTLCIEVQFYLAFCLFLAVAQWVGRRTAGVTVAGLGAAFCCLAMAWPAGLLPATPAWFGQWWYAFLVGAVVWWATDGQLRLWVAAGCLALLGGIAVVRADVAAGVVCGTAAALLACGRVGGLYRWLPYRPVQLMGRWSYCLYLVHVPIAGVVLAVLVRLHPRHEAWGYAALAVVYAVSIGAAAVLHWSVELPSLRWSQRLKRLHERRPPAVQVEDPPVLTPAP